jgi:hypothetical protein
MMYRYRTQYLWAYLNFFLVREFFVAEVFHPRSESQLIYCSNFISLRSMAVYNSLFRIQFLLMRNGIPGYVSRKNVFGYYSLWCREFGEVIRIFETYLNWFVKLLGILMVFFTTF